MHADTFGSTPTTLISAICSNAVRLGFFFFGWLIAGKAFSLSHISTASVSEELPSVKSI